MYVPPNFVLAGEQLNYPESWEKTMTNWSINHENVPVSKIAKWIFRTNQITASG